MPNLTLAQLAQRVRDEGALLRHNGSLLHVSANSEEEWESILDAGSAEISQIEKEVNERFGLKLHLGQFGRGGATVAPIEWYDDCTGNVCFTLDTRDYRGLEGYTELRKVLGALELINRRCREWVKSVVASTR